MSPHIFRGETTLSSNSMFWRASSSPTCSSPQSHRYHTMLEILLPETCVPTCVRRTRRTLREATPRPRRVPFSRDFALTLLLKYPARTANTWILQKNRVRLCSVVGDSCSERQETKKVREENASVVGVGKKHFRFLFCTYKNLKINAQFYEFVDLVCSCVCLVQRSKREDVRAFPSPPHHTFVDWRQASWSK